MENQNTWVDIAFDAFVTLKNDSEWHFFFTFDDSPGHNSWRRKVQKALHLCSSDFRS